MRIIENKNMLTEIVRGLSSGEDKVGLISTMGNIHEGHLTLVRKAREMSDVVMVLAFANPMLVDDPEVLCHLEQSQPADIEILNREDVDYLYFASRDDIFSPGHRTYVYPQGMLKLFTGIEPEQYIKGLATAQFQALNLCRPDFFFIGQKNYLDYILLKRIIRDYHFSTEAILCPTVRDESGRPYSSFNRFHSPEADQAIIRLNQLLHEVREFLMGGENSAAKMVSYLKKSLNDCPKFEILFIGIMDPQTLKPFEKVQREALIMVTGRVGHFRLTDNILFKRKTD